MIKAAIFLNGERTQIPFYLKQDYFIACSDGAFNDLYDQINVHAVIGDFDSVSKPVPNNLKHYIYNQDKTDFEKTLDFLIEHNFRQADVFWGGGGDLDHFLGNLCIAAHYHSKIQLYFHDNQKSYFYQKNSFSYPCSQGKTISLFGFPHAIISSKNLKYEMNSMQLSLTKQQSLRNETTSNYFSLFIKEGGIFCFIDQAKTR